MKHPNRDAWVPYIFGEASPDTVQSLDKHLVECAECREQVQSWRRTLKRLDAWQIPARRQRAAFVPPVFKWAAAAAIVLGIGFGFGRIVPSAGEAKAAARLEASIKSSLATQIQEQVREGVATELQRQLAQRLVAQSNALVALEGRLVDARKADATKLVEELTALLAQQQETDRAVTEALLAKLQDAHDQDLFALRKDLETVATVADEKLVQLASATRLTE